MGYATITYTFDQSRKLQMTWMVVL